MSTTKMGQSRATSAQETRTKLLEAGLELFSKHGFEGVTTRGLAARAKVNQAAIPYHFGGKQGLYLAVAEWVMSGIRPTIILLSKRVQAEAPTLNTNRKALADLLHMIVETLIKNIVANPASLHRQAFIIREYAAPGVAFDIIYDGGVKQMHQAITAIVAAAFKLDPESEEAIIRAHTVVGQVFGFIAGRAVLCQRMNWEGYNRERGLVVAKYASDMALRAAGLHGEEE